MTILILGAGVGGLYAAKQLSKKLRGKAQIILFEKERELVFQPSLLWLLDGHRSVKQITKEAKKIAIGGVEVVQGNVTRIDANERTIEVDRKRYRGDYLILALGSQLHSSEPLTAFGHNFYSVDGGATLADRLNHFRGGSIAVLVSSLPFKCPAAPYEAALLIERSLHRHGVRNNTVISLFTPEPGPMAVAGPEISASVQALLASRGIHYAPDHQVVEVTANSLEFSNGVRAPFDLLAFTPTHRCPDVLANTGLVGSSGWVHVDRETFATSYENVFAIGDLTHVPLEMGKPLPKAGVFAHGQAIVVANNIAHAVMGKPATDRFNGRGECFLETGDGKAGFAHGNFYAVPRPDIALRSPNRLWHWLKIAFEKLWWYKHFQS